MRRNSWAEETEATSPAGAVEAGTADAETDPEASETVRAKAAVVAGIRTGPGIVRVVRKSASNAGKSARNTARSASSTARHGRNGGKSANNAGRSASKRAEIPEAVEIPSAAEVPDSVRSSLVVDTWTTTYRREMPDGGSRLRGHSH